MVEKTISRKMGKKLKLIRKKINKRNQIRKVRKIRKVRMTKRVRKAKVSQSKKTKSRWQKAVQRDLSINSLRQ